jgi:hypothetical protein
LTGYQENKVNYMAQKMSAAERRALHALAPSNNSIIAPAIGRAYHLQLVSSHFGAPSGCYLDAHLSDRKDKRDDFATFASVHSADELGDPLVDQAGVWLMEAVDDLTRNERSEHAIFRLKLLTSHYNCPAGMYLCAVPPDNVPAVPRKSRLSSVKASSSAKAVKRNDDSTWCVVQPLSSCDELTCSTWTLKPGENDGHWQIGVAPTITSSTAEDAMPTRAFLDAHGSSKPDKRNNYSYFVNLHNGFPGCVGEWKFRDATEEADAEMDYMGAGVNSDDVLSKKESSADLGRAGRAVLQESIMATPSSFREPDLGSQSESDESSESSEEESGGKVEGRGKSKVLEEVGALDIADVMALMNEDSDDDDTTTGQLPLPLGAAAEVEVPPSESPANRPPPAIRKTSLRPVASKRKPSLRSSASAHEPPESVTTSPRAASTSKSLVQIKDASVPTFDQLYHIQLCSSHFGSTAGGFLDAPRTRKKDACSTEATYASVHHQSSGGGHHLGQWVLEALSDEDLGTVPILYRSNCFRLKLAAGQESCSAGLYLCGVHPATAAAAAKRKTAAELAGQAETVIKQGSVRKSMRASLSKIGHSSSSSSMSSTKGPSLKRTKESSWCVVQTLDSCAHNQASPIWTLQPAAGASDNSSSSSSSSQGGNHFSLGVVHERHAASENLMPFGSSSLCFLDAHGSDKKDERDDHSSYVNCHEDHPEAVDCKGVWSFHAVTPDLTALASWTSSDLDLGQTGTIGMAADEVRGSSHNGGEGGGSKAALRGKGRTMLGSALAVPTDVAAVRVENGLRFTSFSLCSASNVI